MADLHTGVQTIPGIGPQRAKALERSLEVPIPDEVYARLAKEMETNG